MGREVYDEVQVGVVGEGGRERAVSQALRAHAAMATPASDGAVRKVD